MKKFFLPAALVLTAAVATAQPPAPLDLQVALSGSQIDSINGTSTNAEFDGVAVAPNASVFYVFDSIGTFDGIFTSQGPAVFATEAQLSGGGGASAGDMDTDSSGSLYVSTFDGSRQRIWKIAPTGFTGAVEMVAAGSAVQLDEIEVDEANNRLFLTYNDAFGATAEDVVHVPLNANAATPTVLATEAAIEAALANIPGYGDDTLDDLNITDLTVQNDGDIIIAHGFGSNRQVNGSLLRITPAGAVNVFRTADEIIAAAGVDPSTLDIGSLNVEALSDDQILVHVQFTSSSNVFPPFICVVSANGTSQRMLATESQLRGDSSITSTLVPDGQFLFRMDGKGGDVAANDDYFFYRQSTSGGTAAENAVLRLTGIRQLLDTPLPTAAQDWTLFE